MLIEYIPNSNINANIAMSKITLGHEDNHDCYSGTIKVLWCVNLCLPHHVMLGQGGWVHDHWLLNTPLPSTWQYPFLTSAGYVGPGMLSAAVAGAVFTSPPPDSILAAIRAVGRNNPGEY